MNWWARRGHPPVHERAEEEEEEEENDGIEVNVKPSSEVPTRFA
jgi:hypothetical protein